MDNVRRLTTHSTISSSTISPMARSLFMRMVNSVARISVETEGKHLDLISKEDAGMVD